MKKEIFKYLFSIPKYIFKSPFAILNDEKTEKYNLDDAFLNVIKSVYKSRFDEDQQDKKIILEARSEALKNESMDIKNSIFTITIKGLANTSRISDMKNTPLYLFKKYEEREYIPRLTSFLSVRNVLLIKETPNDFLISYSEFFDEFLVDYVKNRMKEDFGFDLSWNDVKNKCSRFFISEEVRQKELFKNWEDECFKETRKIFEDKFKQFLDDKSKEVPEDDKSKRLSEDNTDLN